MPFRYAGVDYLVRPPATWAKPARDLLAASRIVAALELILGPAQLAAFRATKPTTGDVQGLLAALAADFGLSVAARTSGRHGPLRSRRRRR